MSVVKDIGDNSCNGEVACYQEGGQAAISIGDTSCIGDRACALNAGNVSLFGCIGDGACVLNQADIGYKSCDGYYSCYFNLAPIGKMILTTEELENYDGEPEGSCLNIEVRTEADKEALKISDPDYNFNGACQQNAGVVGTGSCTSGRGNSCCANVVEISDNTCTVEEECSNCN